MWLVVAAGGLAIGVARGGEPWRRVAALAGATALLAWPLLPYSSHVAFNLRYAFAGLALGAILLAIRCRAQWAFAALALAGVLHVDPLHGSNRPAALAVAIAVTVLVATWPGRPAAAGLALAGVAVGAALSGSFAASPHAYQGPAAEAVRPHAAWTASDPAARLVLRFPRGVTVSAIDGLVDPAGC